MTIPRLSPVVVAMVLGVTSLVRGEVLFQQNFDHEQTEQLMPRTIRGVFPWEGRSPKEFGWISVEGERSALAFHDSSELRNQSPTVKLSWDGKGKDSGAVALSWDFNIPAAGKFMAVHFIGGDNWNNSALVLLIVNGEIIVHADKGDEGRVNIGAYSPGKWQTIMIKLDESARTFDVWLDGKQVLNGYPMLAKAPSKADSMVIAADTSTRQWDDAAVLFIDNISVVTAP